MVWDIALPHTSVVFKSSSAAVHAVGGGALVVMPGEGLNIRPCSGLSGHHAYSLLPKTRDKARRVIAEIKECLSLCRRPAFRATGVPAFDSAAREADRISSLRGLLKPGRVGAVVGHHDGGRDAPLGSIGEHLIDEVRNAGLRIGRVQPDAAVPLLSQSVIFPSEITLGLDGLPGPVAAGRVKLYDAENSTRYLDILRGRVPFVPGAVRPIIGLLAHGHAVCGAVKYEPIPIDILETISPL